MEVISNREETIYRKEFEGKPTYSVALSKKEKVYLIDFIKLKNI